MSAYPVNKERINYSRLCRAIVDLCTDVFQDILNRRVKPNNLMTTLTKCADFSRFKAQDRTSICNAGGAGSYKNFDITMLYQIMRATFTQDLRDALKTNIDPSQINTAVQNCSTLSSYLTPGDVTAINKSVTTKSYDNLKDELLWTLYGQLCKANPVTSLVHPSKSWGQTPDQGAINLGDDIERIRILRNTVYGHISTTEINDVDFREHWRTLSDVMLRIDSYLSSRHKKSRHKKSLDDIEVSSLDMGAEEKYFDHIRKLAEKQKEISDDVTEFKIDVTEKHDKMDKDVTALKTKVALVTEEQNKMAEDVTQVQDRMTSDVSGLNTRVATVNEKHEQMAEDVTGLKTVLYKITNSQKELARNVSQLEKGDVTGLKNVVAKVTETQDVMAGDITGLKTDFTKVTETQDEIAGDVTKLKNDVDTIKETQKELQLKKDQVPDPVPGNLRKRYSIRFKEWEDEDKVFTETKACKNVRKAITQNTFVTVSGNAGSGKSAIIHHIALEYKSKGFDVLPVKDPDDIEKYLQVDQKQLFVYDDPLGVHCIDMDKLKKWKDFKIGSSEMTTKMKVLCSVRRQIVNEPDFKAHGKFLNKMVVDIEDDNNRLSLEEKVKMIKKHIEIKQIELIITENAKRIFENQKEFFPLTCKMFVDSYVSKKNKDWTFFQNPFELILKDLDYFKSFDKVKYCILILCLISKNGLNPELYSPLSTYELTKENSFILACGLKDHKELLAKFRDTYESLLNVYLKWENEMLSFSHDLILDVVAYHFGQNYPNVILEHFPFEFISRRVIVGEFEENDPYIIRLETKNVNSLVERMLKELEKREFKAVFMNKSWRNDSFLEAFRQQMVDETGQFCYRVLDILTEHQKQNKKNESELKKISESNALSTWTWYYTAMLLLRCPCVTALHWIAVFGHTSLFEFIWKNLSSHQKRSVGKGIPLLHLACLGGDIEIFNKVLQTEGIKVNTPLTPYYDFYPIHAAVYKNEDIIKDLITLGADINVKNSSGAGRTALFYAAACNNVKTGNILIQHGYVSGQCECSHCTSETYNKNKTCKSISKINIDIKDDNGLTPLYISAETNSADVAKLLLEYKADPNLCNNNGCSPLYISAQNNSADVAKLLLGNKADPNLCENNGKTPLYISAHNNSADVAKLLLGNKADPNLCENNGKTPLYISAHNNSADVAKLLLGNKADPNLCNKNGASPLYISAETNSADVAKLLLEYKADPNLCKNNGVSSLYISAQTNSADVAKLLLGNKADPNLCANDGVSPLYISAQNNSADVAKLLLENKADPNLCENDGVSPLYISAQTNSADVAKLLLENKADPNLCKNNGASPLCISAQTNSADVAKLLLENKADPNLCNKKGFSPLYVSAQYNSVDVAKLLLENKADPNLCENDGASPLYISAQTNRADVAKLLLEYKADPNLCENDGLSPLYISAQYINVDVAKLLLENKADPNLYDNDGLNPLCISAQYNSADVAKLLLEYKAGPNGDGVTVLYKLTSD